jgi:hypothetical protein
VGERREEWAKNRVVGEKEKRRKEAGEGVGGCECAFSAISLRDVLHLIGSTLVFLERKGKG